MSGAGEPGAEQEDEGTARPSCLKGCLWLVCGVVLLVGVFSFVAWARHRAEENKATRDDGTVTFADVRDQTANDSYWISGPVIGVVDHGKGSLSVSIVYGDGADGTRTPYPLKAVVNYSNGLRVSCEARRAYLRNGDQVETVGLECKTPLFLDPDAYVVVTAPA